MRGTDRITRQRFCFFHNSSIIHEYTNVSKKIQNIWLKKIWRVNVWHIFYFKTKTYLKASQFQQVSYLALCMFVVKCQQLYPIYRRSIKTILQLIQPRHPCRCFGRMKVTQQAEEDWHINMFRCSNSSDLTSTSGNGCLWELNPAGTSLDPGVHHSRAGMQLLSKWLKIQTNFLIFCHTETFSILVLITLYFSPSRLEFFFSIRNQMQTHYTKRIALLHRILFIKWK